MSYINIKYMFYHLLMYLLYNNLYKEKSYYFLISNMKNFNEILKIKNRKMLDVYQA